MDDHAALDDLDNISDVQVLLNTWGLPELWPEFARNGINLEALAALSLNDIKELIPQLGPRALFVRSWRSWVTQPTEELNISNITVQDLIIIEENNQPAQPLRAKPSPIKEDLRPPCSFEWNELANLLKSDLETSMLLAYQGRSLQNENARNLLACAISKQILKDNKNSIITGSVYTKWVKQIKQLFPEERVTTYYIPPCVTAQGTSHQARGKLISQLMNIRRKYQKLGVLDAKRKLHTQLEDSENARPSPRSVPEVPESITNRATIDDIKWLKSSSEPWQLVQAKWKNTHSERSKDLAQGPRYTIEQYVQDYPALQKPDGYKLLLDYFESSYPESINNLFLNFPTVKDELIKLVTKKATKKDVHINEIILLANGTNEENKNLAAVLALPELISPVLVALPGEQPTSSTAAKRRKAKDTKHWKPTKAESREAFVVHIRDDSYLKVVMNKRLEKTIEKGFTPQPYIVIVGENLFTIKSYFVVVNPNTFYRCSNILAAIDSCFKITWSLNLEYAPCTYGCWFFIQKGLYKLSSPSDKGSTSVESLMTDCNLVN